MLAENHNLDVQQECTNCSIFHLNEVYPLTAFATESWASTTTVTVLGSWLMTTEEYESLQNDLVRKMLLIYCGQELYRSKTVKVVL